MPPATRPRDPEVQNDRIGDAVSGLRQMLREGRDRIRVESRP